MSLLGKDMEEEPALKVDAGMKEQSWHKGKSSYASFSAGLSKVPSVRPVS